MLEKSIHVVTILKPAEFTIFLVKVALHKIMNLL